MRQIIISCLPLLLSAACGLGPRAVDGTAEKGTAAVIAVDSAGKTFTTRPDGNLGFHLTVDTTRPIFIFAVKGNGEMQAVKFASKLGGAPTARKIPNYGGTVHMGALSTCDCNGDGSTNGEAASSDNPLDQVDTDGDGQPDLADADDDGDGINDESDGDSDGNNVDDSAENDDSDGDGTPDQQDGHDDGEGDAADGEGDAADGEGDAADGEGDAAAGEGEPEPAGEGEPEPAGEGEGEGEGDPAEPPPGDPPPAP